MSDFPNNSYRAERQKPSASAPSESSAAPVDNEPIKLEPVVQGSVIRRKKPLGRRLRETFFAPDSGNVWAYLARDVILPSIQNIVVDVVTQGFQKAVYGSVQPMGRPGMARPYNPNVGRTHVSYDRQYPSPSSAPVRPSAGPAAHSSQQRSSVDIDLIVLDTYEEAAMTLNRMGEIIQEYHSISVGQLNDLLHQTSPHTAHRYGWYDLSGARILRYRNAYALDLPNPVDLR